jgi:hypothetical protein
LAFIKKSVKFGKRESAEFSAKLTTGIQKKSIKCLMSGKTTNRQIQISQKFSKYHDSKL